MARLNEYYRSTVVKQLTEKFQYGNPMQVPRITKITLNMGVGEAVGDRKVLDDGRKVRVFKSNGEVVDV
jgi:large subunit ribosomal protein L5